MNEKQSGEADVRRSRIIDVLLGGAGGAIVAALITILFGLYFDTVERQAAIHTKQEILAAKELVTQQIADARAIERNHLLEAISIAQNAQARATIATEKAEKSATSISDQEQRIKKIIEGLEEKAGGTVETIANALGPEVLAEVRRASFPPAAVVAFNGSCPKEGWFPLKEAEGRMIVGASRNFPLRKTGGAVEHTLTPDEMPRHSHVRSNAVVKGKTGIGGNGGSWVSGHADQRTSVDGGGTAHNNMPPYIALVFCQKQ